MGERGQPPPRENGLSLPAIPVGVTSLKSGALSVTFHVPFECAERAFSVHELQGKSVTLRITEDE